MISYLCNNQDIIGKLVALPYFFETFKRLQAVIANVKCLK